MSRKEAPRIGLLKALVASRVIGRGAHGLGVLYCDHSLASGSDCHLGSRLQDPTSQGAATR
jgi:hypothetical protein